MIFNQEKEELGRSEADKKGNLKPKHFCKVELDIKDLTKKDLQFDDFPPEDIDVVKGGCCQSRKNADPAEEEKDEEDKEKD